MLLGGNVWAEQSSFAARGVVAVVDRELRTPGPSLLFETGGHSLWRMPPDCANGQQSLDRSFYYSIS
jgi:hypothetical protein